MKGLQRAWGAQDQGPHPLPTKSKETTKSEQPTSSSLRQLTSRPAQLVLTAQNWPKRAKTPRFPYKNPRHGTTMTWV